MNNILNSFVIFISLFTATGVFVHEAHIDRVTATSVSVRHSAQKKMVKAPTTPADANIGAEPHVHGEHGQRTLKGFSYKTPTAPPREQKMKKYLMQNIEPRGRHAFDNHNLPLVA